GAVRRCLGYGRGRMGMLSRLDDLRGRTFAAIVVAALGLETLACLLLSVEGRHSVIGAADARQYELYGRNLIDHGVFSSAADPPYSPGVFRTPGYPAFLAALRLVGGDSLVLVRI